MKREPQTEVWSMGRGWEGLSLERPRECGSVDNGTLDFRLPELGELAFLFLKAPSLGYFVTAARETELHTLTGREG